MVKTTCLHLFSLALFAGALATGCSAESNDEPEPTIEGGPVTKTETGADPGRGVDAVSAVDATYRESLRVRGPDDECVEGEANWTLHFEASVLRATLCREATAERPGRHWETHYIEPGAGVLADLKQKLLAIRPAPKPDSCAADLPSHALTLRWPDKTERYVESSLGACGVEPSAVLVDGAALSAFLEALREVSPAAPRGVADGTETSAEVRNSPGYGVKGPDDECLAEEGRWQVDFAAGTLRATHCKEATPGGPKRLETRDVRLDEGAELALRAALEGVRPAPRPETCVVDATWTSLDLAGPAGAFSYANPASSCGKVGTPVVGDEGLRALIARLRALGER